MSWKLVKKNKDILNLEKGACLKDRGGKTSVALVYPNTYYVGMSNLAVHSIYQRLNESENIVCERAFLPDKESVSEHIRTDTPVLTIESQRPISEFDVIAFTVSFENDLLNIIPIMEQSKIEALAENRPEEGPVILAGGAAVSLNPEPLKEIVDICITGEFEAYAEGLTAILASEKDKKHLISSIEKLKEKLSHDTSRPPFSKIVDFKTQTVIHTPNTEFGNMHLIEVMRGCPRMCAFCATPGLYNPLRMRSKKLIMEMVEEGLAFKNKFGLIGADIISHPDFKDMASFILGKGATFSLSSVRIDRIDPETAGLFFRAGMRSLSFGIEAGSEALRKSLGKKFTNGECMESVKILAEAGIANIRLYFMIGLPDESREDIEAISDFAGETLKAIQTSAPKTRRSSSLELTVTPFVPKRLSFFHDKKFAGVERINEIQKYLKKKLGGNKSIRLSFDSAQQAMVEAYLAKADRGASNFLKDAASLGMKAAIKKYL